MIEIKIPADQTEGTSNVVGKWFKSVGDTVAANDPLLEITTDKVTVEIAAPSDGVLVEIVKAEGESVEQGDVLGRLDPSALGPRPTAPAGERTQRAAEPAAASGADTELAPAVRRLINEHGLDPASIQGTGRGGRITVADVEAVIATGGSTGGKRSRLVPHSAMRKSIAAHMVQSVATAPHVTSVFEADLSAVILHREVNRSAYDGRGVKLTLTAYFVRAAVEALAAVPERWRDDALELFDDANIGIGTALESGGLIVPVIKQAQTLDLFQTAERLQDLTSRARIGGLSPSDVQGGTFTISNHGVSGSLIAAPIIINQPQSAILGVGKVEKRPVVKGDDIVVTPRVYVTLTIDHRVLDGFQANAFLSKWVHVIERWG
jgi:2-oxoglutarate dehydrogenase E2 component (dihydrolipoamide succinyltransferase)